MSRHPTYTYKCDACGATKTSLKTPHGWVSPNLVEKDGDAYYNLHVCPNCARLAVDEWLPANTWWGSTKHWGVVE